MHMIVHRVFAKLTNLVLPEFSPNVPQSGNRKMKPDVATDQFFTVRPLEGQVSVQLTSQQVVTKDKFFLNCKTIANFELFFNLEFATRLPKPSFEA